MEVPTKVARVWIVDDSATARLQLERLLSPRYEVAMFADGAAVIEQLQHGAPHLLVLDWEMPIMSGLEICRFVRTQRDEIELPILVVTATTELEAAREALAAGANDLVRRPFDGFELLARIKNLLRLGTLSNDRVAALQTLFAQVPAAVAHLRGPRHTYTMVNAAYAKMVGAHAVGAGFRDAPPGRPSPALLAQLDRAYATGEAFHVEDALVPVRDGGAVSELYFDFTYQPTRDGAGDVDGIFVHAVDVTESVHAKQRARFDADQLARLQRSTEDARAEFAELFRQAPVAIAVLRGATHVVTLANPHVCELWGRSAAAVLDKPLFEAMPEIVGQGLEALLAGVLDTGVPFIGNELLVQIARGPRGILEGVYFNFVYQPMRGGDGRVDAVLVIATDVTESVLARREATRLADEVHEREDRLRLALEASEAGAWEVDLITREFHADKLVRALFHLHPTDALPGGAGLQKIHPDDAARVQRGVALTLAGKDAGVFAEQYRIVAPDGDVTWVLSRGQAYFDERGTAKRFLGTLFDITARKQTEALREALLEAEQTARLAAEKQRDFEKYVVGIVSHDLRTPMQAISMGTELLLSSGTQDAAAQRTLGRVKNNAERATRLILDVLDFTQIRLGGGFTLHPARVDLAAITAEMVDEARAAWPARRIEITRDGDTFGAWDADRLAQVAANLIGNALKYGDATGVVSVAVTGTATEGILSVHNHGPVIPEERMRSLFLPMYRGTLDPNNAQRSVGLGLYIVEAIATAHHGSIEVASTAAEGTTFRMRLPKHSDA